MLSTCLTLYSNTVCSQCGVVIQCAVQYPNFTGGGCRVYDHSLILHSYHFHHFITDYRQLNTQTVDVEALHRQWLHQINDIHRRCFAMLLKVRVHRTQKCNHTSLAHFGWFHIFPLLYRKCNVVNYPQDGAVYQTEADSILDLCASTYVELSCSWTVEFKLQKRFVAQ